LIGSLECVSDINPIHKDELRLAATGETFATIDVGQDGLERVGLASLVAVRDDDGTNAKELIVERVVDHVHVVVGITLSAIDLARELAIRNRKLILPDVVKFRKDIGYLTGIHIIIHKDDDPLARIDHLSKGRPVLETHSRVGRGVHEGLDARLSNNGLPPLFDIKFVRVGQDEGEHFIGVRVQPALDLVEIINEFATIFEEAASVAHFEVTILIMSRALEEPHTEVELLKDINVLVRREVEDALGNREGVVSANGDDVAVGAVAKLSMAIANGSPLLSGRGGSDRSSSESQQQRFNGKHLSQSNERNVIQRNESIDWETGRV
jgi:hypothetical protein